MYTEYKEARHKIYIETLHISKSYELGMTNKIKEIVQDNARRFQETYFGLNKFSDYIILPLVCELNTDY